VEKRPSTDGLVDNIDPRESHELEELPYVEKPAPTEPAPLPLKEKLITCFWIALNTLSTLGLIFLSKKYAYPQHLHQDMANTSAESSAMPRSRNASSW
jgi:hypothetical protein